MLESKERRGIFFSFFVTALISFYFLGNGYLFTLDGLTGSLVGVNSVSISNSTMVFEYLHFLGSFLFGSMYTHQLYLFIVVFGVLFLSIIYFPRLNIVDHKMEEVVKYVVSIFYVVNPFVWERFLAGQWGVLAGYALLWPFVYYLVEFVRECNEHLCHKGTLGTQGDIPEYKKIFGYEVEVSSFAKLLSATFLVGAVSFHFLIMCFVILFFTFIYLLILNRKYFQTNFKKLFIVAGVFVLASSYWLVPTVWNMYNNEYVVQGFGGADRQAFMTTVYGESEISKALNIFNLYGFWGERHPWAAQFEILPNNKAIVFLPVLIIILIGIVRLCTIPLSNGEGQGEGRTRNWKVGVVVAGGVIFSAIFSLGVADTIFKPVNEWLFNNVFFWNGFRDSQKWTGMLIVFMSVGLGVGLSFILEKINNFKLIKNQDLKRNTGIVFLCVIAMCIMLYTPKVLTGFSDKLRPVDYPATWYQANEIMQQDLVTSGQDKCEAVFLPWHMYYYLGFNNNLLTANPAQKFFDCKTYTSLDPEIGEVGVGVVKDKKALAVHQAMQDFFQNKIDMYEVVGKLRNQNVQYIIITSDSLRGDRIFNPKNVPGIEQIYDSVDIAVFRL